jgi:hypothetical protein
MYTHMYTFAVAGNAENAASDAHDEAVEGASDAAQKVASRAEEKVGAVGRLGLSWLAFIMCSLLGRMQEGANKNKVVFGWLYACVISTCVCVYV